LKIQIKIDQNNLGEKKITKPLSSQERLLLPVKPKKRISQIIDDKDLRCKPKPRKLTTWPKTIKADVELA